MAIAEVILNYEIIESKLILYEQTLHKIVYGIL